MKKEVLILVLGLVLISGCNEITNYDNFVNCLEEKDVKLYGSFQCSHCEEQKEMFKNSTELLVENVYVECGALSSFNEDCRNNNVSAVPMWVINNESYLGTMSLDKISKLSGCDLK